MKSGFDSPFDSPEFLVHMTKARLTHIELLKAQIAEEITTCKRCIEMLENLDDQKDLAQELESQLNGVSETKPICAKACSKSWYYRAEAGSEMPIWILLTESLDVLAQIYPDRSKVMLIMPNFKRVFGNALIAKRFATQHYEGIENEG